MNLTFRFGRVGRERFFCFHDYLMQLSCTRRFHKRRTEHLGSFLSDYSIDRLYRLSIPQAFLVEVINVIPIGIVTTPTKKPPVASIR